MRETAVKGLFWRWGIRVYKLRFVVLALWAAAFIVFGVFAQKAPGLLTDNGFNPTGSQSDIGLKQMREALHTPASIMTLVYESGTLNLTEETAKQEIMDSLAELRKLPYVEQISFSNAPRLEQANKGVLAVNVMMNTETDESLTHYPELKSKLAAPPDMKVYITGGMAGLYDMQKASKSDILKAELIGLPIALIVLLAVFGTIVGALLPLVVGVISVTTTLGVVYFIAQSYSLSNFLPNLVTMLGLAVGIDYALFLVSRFREELKRQPSVGEAVAMTCQTAGQSIFFSGIAVLIGLLGMMLIDLNFFRSLSLGGLIVVSVSVLAANTLLPAFLGVLGTKINSLQVLPKFLRERRQDSRFWHTVAYAVMKRPIVLVILIMAALIYAMTPIAQIKYGLPSAEGLPPTYDSRYGSDLMKRTYDMREVNGLQVVVKAEKPYWDEASITETRKLADRLKGTEGVKAVHSYLDAVEGRSVQEAAAILGQKQVRDQVEAGKAAGDRYAVLGVVPLSDPEDSATDRLVERLRAIDPGSLEMAVTGGPAYRYDVMDRIQSKLLSVLGFVFGVTFIVLLFAFRSILLPIKAVLMNVLSLGASLGIVVAVFQYGHFAGLLHITSIGYVNAMLPVIIFCVVFGISMDYEVFLISRIQEEYEKTWDNERSTADGLKRTGGLITSAAFILIVVVGSFVVTDIEMMKAMGLGLGLAVLIDATVIRILLVPALMKLLGKANWWAPRWLRPSVKPSERAD